MATEVEQETSDVAVEIRQMKTTNHIHPFKRHQRVVLTNGMTCTIESVSFGGRKDEQRREPYYYEVNHPSGSRFTVGHSEIVEVKS